MAGLLAYASTIASAQTPDAQRPNFLLVNNDQCRFGQRGLFGLRRLGVGEETIETEASRIIENQNLAPDLEVTGAAVFSDCIQVSLASEAAYLPSISEESVWYTNVIANLSSRFHVEPGQVYLQMIRPGGGETLEFSSAGILARGHATESGRAAYLIPARDAVGEFNSPANEENYELLVRTQRAVLAQLSARLPTLPIHTNAAGYSPHAPAVFQTGGSDDAAEFVIASARGFVTPNRWERLRMNVSLSLGTCGAAPRFRPIVALSGEYANAASTSAPQEAVYQYSLARDHADGVRRRTQQLTTSLQRTLDAITHCAHP